MGSYIVAALYHFVPLPTFSDMKAPILDFCQSHSVKGTLLLAAEGINGTIAGSREGIDHVLAYLRSFEPLQSLQHKESYAHQPPFHRMKVSLKKEIVTMGVDGVDPLKTVGTYVKPKAWNQLIQDPNVLLIDTRNQYETKIGSFEGAIDPQTTTFREFPQWVEQQQDALQQKPKIAMFCTGGIRCEKATSYLKQQGFDDVYHLEGGILKYLEEVDEEESLWHGECFVFDERVSVGHQLVPGPYDLCHGCRSPISQADKESEYYVKGVSCPHCYHTLTAEQKARFQERQKQMNLAQQNDRKHLGQSIDQQKQRKQHIKQLADQNALAHQKTPIKADEHSKQST